MRMDKPQIISHIQKSLNYTVFDVKWVPRSAKFIVLGSFARATGTLQIYEVVEGDVKLIKECEKSGALKCGTFGASSLYQRYLATGDFKGKLQLWNLESPDVPVYSANAHEQIINTIDGVGGLGIGVGAPEIVTGSRDGTVKVWDTRQKDSPVAEMKPVEQQERRDCWSVAFGHAHTSDERCICAGYDNGDIKLFDLRTMAARWETNVRDGVCSLEFDRKDINMNKLVATTMQSQIHIFDARTQHPTKGFASIVQTAHKSTVWCVRHLPQNRDIFATTGGNGTVNLWKYNYPEKRSVKNSDGELEGQMGTVSKLQWLKASSQPVSSFDWNHDKLGLAVCSSFDQMLQVLIVTKLNRV